jgi:carboxypeptidase T
MNLLACLTWIALTSVGASAEPPHPRLVRVTLLPPASLTTLLETGLDVIRIEDERHALVYEWPGDEAELARIGGRFEVIDPDPGRTAAARSAADRAARPAAPKRRVWSAARGDGRFRFESVPPTGAGSTGGFHTIAEIKMSLDALVAGDPGNVVADKIDTLGWTWQGRPIWGLALGRPGAPENPSPVAFYNGLTHAREPESMEIVLHFGSEIVARYGQDSFVTWLLEHRRIYLVPLVNPDGYAENEDTWFRTGGLSFGQVRKNARDNDHNGVYDPLKDGVDINRNYGFRWGKDNTGSSGNSRDSDYRGPTPFSEPETRAQRDAVIALRPKTLLTFHSFSDLYYHAWAHTESLVVEADAYHEWSDLLTRTNAYQSGGGALGLYLANGDGADWCYGDTLSKPAVYAWTPETGSDFDGFWPIPARIVEIADENLGSCLMAAAIAGPFVGADGVTLLEGAMNAGHTTRVEVQARNIGASGIAGPGLTGNLMALDAGAHVLIGAADYPALSSRQSGAPIGPFAVAVDDTVTPGRSMRFAIEFADPAGLSSRDTIAIPVGTPTVLASDGASAGLGQWSSGGWGIVTGDPQHPSRYFTDSPAGAYAANADQILARAGSLDLSHGVHAYVEYEARWLFEKDYDAAAFEASLDGTSFNRIAATRTTRGSGMGTQTFAEPYHAGSQWRWHAERADLSAYTGAAASAVRLRFRTRSNAALQFDGFSFDSFRVSIYDPAMQPQPAAVGIARASIALALDAPVPNPARNVARFEFEIPRESDVRVDVVDLQGRRVQTIGEWRLRPGRYARTWDARDQAGRPMAAGMYFVRLEAGGSMRTRRLVVAR